MTTTALAIAQQQEDTALNQLLDMSISGLEDENKLLAAAGSTIQGTANSIYFTNCEVVYAYLIRRSLAVKGFLYQVSHEECYPSVHRQHVDLQISFPGADQQSPRLFGIEMKYVSDEGDKALSDVLNDVMKLLAESGYERRYVLLFPMCSNDGPVDAHHFAKHLQEFAATNPTNWRQFGYRTIGERSFDCQPHDFRLALIEVLPAAD